MKTKIIYISGNEIFDMNDIRAAFEEVRLALKLDKNTVLFGVPVDSEDAGFATKNDGLTQPDKIPEIIADDVQPIVESDVIEPEKETILEPVDEQDVSEPIESVENEPVKKRGRPRKEITIEPEDVAESNTEIITESDEKVVPILSVLSVKEDVIDDVVEDVTDVKDEIIPEISDEIVENTTSVEIQTVDTADDDEADLEKLLSAMTPLDESVDTEILVDDTPNDVGEDISVDATLEQLATEFAEKQDKIVSETKTTSRNRIGKLRNILPFKQSKHKDSGLGDLFGWAGIAANDEEFSVPGFFTNAASRK